MKKLALLAAVFAVTAPQLVMAVKSAPDTKVLCVRVGGWGFDCGSALLNKSGLQGGVRWTVAQKGQESKACTKFNAELVVPTTQNGYSNADVIKMKTQTFKNAKCQAK